MFQIEERVRALLLDAGLAVVRLSAGVHLAALHGRKKFPFPDEGFVKGVGDMGFPAPGFFAFMAGLAEFAGGICLALGLGTRVSAILIASTMAVAGFLRHADDPWAKKELAFLYLAMAILFLLAGGGRFSADRLIGTWWRRRKGSRRA